MASAPRSRRRSPTSTSARRSANCRKGSARRRSRRTSNAILNELKLEKYRTTVKQELTLDLRENRRVKSEAAAFLDLHRSSFFHRLRVLEIGFAKLVGSGQQSTTWAEKWHLQWSPESEIALVEAVLLGETVELATAYKFKTQLEECTSIAEAADMVRDACQCGMMGSMELARRRLQELAAESSDFRRSLTPRSS